MKNRLVVAQELLSKDGIIFIHIDHHELSYLNVLMNEVFGEENFIQLITVEGATPAGFKTVNPGPVDVSDYILMYSKDNSSYEYDDFFVASDYVDDYDKYIINPEDDPEDWKIGRIKDVVYEKLGVDGWREAKDKFGEAYKHVVREIQSEFALNNAERTFATYSPHRPSGKLEEMVKESKESPQKVFYHKREEGKSPFYVRNGRLFAFYKDKLKEIDGELVPTELLTNFWDDISFDSLSHEGGVTLRAGKKPEKLLRRIIEMSTDEEDTILDFFLGSGTTAAVAHKTNRNYIGIEQLDYGENDPIVRLKNVVEGDSTGISDSVDWEGGGSFVYAELLKWNQKYIDKIQEAQTKGKLLEIWENMKEEAFLSYQVDPQQFDGNIEEFKNLEIKDQKDFLLKTLDKNHLYVNLSEIDDEEYDISEEVKKMNQEFYGEL